MRPSLFMLAAAIAAAPVQAAPTGSVERDKAAILTEFTDLLAIPNVATDVGDIRRNADHIMAMMTRRGLAPRLLEGDNENVPPAIYGEWLVPGAKKTLVLYAHYDGQPVTPEDWKSTQPFEPKFYSDRLDRGGKQIAFPADQPIDPEWRIYARSASDDKLGVMAILEAVSALKAQGKRPAYNLKIFFEGEEEMGSPNLAVPACPASRCTEVRRLGDLRRPLPSERSAAGFAWRSRRHQCRRDRSWAGPSRCTADIMAIGSPTPRWCLASYWPP